MKRKYVIPAIEVSKLSFSADIAAQCYLYNKMDSATSNCTSWVDDGYGEYCIPTVGSGEPGEDNIYTRTAS